MYVFCCPHMNFPSERVTIQGNLLIVHVDNVFPHIRSCYFIHWKFLFQVINTSNFLLSTCNKRHRCEQLYVQNRYVQITVFLFVSTTVTLWFFNILFKISVSWLVSVYCLILSLYYYLLTLNSGRRCWTCIQKW